MLIGTAFLLKPNQVQEFLYPLISTIVTAVITWFLAKRKNNAEAKLAEIDAEVKAGEFYRSLLDDAKTRLEDAFKSIEERDRIIKAQDEEKREMQRQIKVFIEDIESLTTEIKKFKQLNGKSAQ